MPNPKLPGTEPSEVVQHFLYELNLVSGNPRLSILIINGFMELMVNILIRNKLKHGKKIEEDTRGYTYSTKLIILNEIGIISDDLFYNMDKLRELRNNAAHQPFFTVKDSDMEKFRPIVFDQNQWKNLIKEKGISWIAALIWGCLWNLDPEMYLKTFENIQKKSLSNTFLNKNI